MSCSGLEAHMQATSKGPQACFVCKCLHTALLAHFTTNTPAAATNIHTCVADVGDASPAAPAKCRCKAGDDDCSGILAPCDAGSPHVLLADWVMVDNHCDGDELKNGCRGQEDGRQDPLRSARESAEDVERANRQIRRRHLCLDVEQRAGRTHEGLTSCTATQCTG